MATSVSTLTMDKDVIAFYFDQQGLMAAINLQGSKITRINPGP
jgi:lipid-binding SYLF domain-containing protein